jgi:hypothetical protein
LALKILKELKNARVVTAVDIALEAAPVLVPQKKAVSDITI